MLEHPEQELEAVQFGMKIIRTCQSSFERQIFESVLIQQARKEHNVLNSRSEYNRCSLPRLTTQIGEQEFDKYNKELLEEKKQEEKLEQKIRTIRKLRNKNRLMPSKPLNQGTKRRKINENEYITIQEMWGEPEVTEPRKNKLEPENQEFNPNSKKMRTNHHPSDENISTKTSDCGEQFNSTDTARNREPSRKEGGKSPNEFTTEGNTSTEAGGEQLSSTITTKIEDWEEILSTNIMPSTANTKGDTELNSTVTIGNEESASTVTTEGSTSLNCGEEASRRFITQGGEQVLRKRPKTSLTNCRRVENRIIQGEQENLEWAEPVNWEQRLEEHRLRLEKEKQDKLDRLEKQKKKENGWELYRLCKQILEQNDSKWNKLKEKEQEEQERLKRLEKARIQAKKTRCNILERTQNEIVEKLPKQVRENFIVEQVKQERLELQKTRKNLWKLRKTEEKLEETEEIKKIRKLDKNMELVEQVLIEEKKKLLEQEKETRKTYNKNKLNSIKEKEQKKKELARIWATYRWVTDTMEQNANKWEQEVEKYKQSEEKSLEEWNKLTRKQKIEKIKQENHKKIENTPIKPKILQPKLVKMEQTAFQKETPSKSPPPPPPRNSTINPQQKTMTDYITRKTVTNKQQINNAENNKNNNKIPTKKTINTPVGKKNKQEKQHNQKTLERYRGFWTNLAATQKIQKQENKLSPNLLKSDDVPEIVKSQNSKSDMVTNIANIAGRQIIRESSYLNNQGINNESESNNLLPELKVKERKSRDRNPD